MKFAALSALALVTGMVTGAALRKARIVHAAHRQAARPLLARLAELEKARDVDLAALFLPPTKADALAAQEKRRAA